MKVIGRLLIHEAFDERIDECEAGFHTQPQFDLAFRRMMLSVQIA